MYALELDKKTTFSSKFVKNFLIKTLLNIGAIRGVCRGERPHDTENGRFVGKFEFVRQLSAKLRQSVICFLFMQDF